MPNVPAVLAALVLVTASACSSGSDPDPAQVAPDAARVIDATTDCAELGAMSDLAFQRFGLLADSEKVGRLGDLNQAQLALVADRMEEVGCP